MSGENSLKRAKLRKPSTNSKGLPASFRPLATSSGKDTSSETSEVDVKRRSSSSEDSDFLTVSSGMSFDDLLSPPSLLRSVEAQSSVPEINVVPGPVPAPKTWSFYPRKDESTKGKKISVDFKLQLIVVN